MTLQHLVDLAMSDNGNVCKLRQQNCSSPAKAARFP
jgi:hypothetical protein